MIGSKPLIERIMDGHAAPGFGSVIDPFAIPQPMAAPMPFEMRQSPASAILEPAGDIPTTSECLDGINRELISHAAENEGSKQLLIRWFSFREEMERIFNASKNERRTSIENKIMELSQAGRVILDRIVGLKNQQAAAQVRYNANEEIAAPLRVNLQSALNANPDKDPDGWATDSERAAWKIRVEEARAALAAQDAEARLLLQDVNEIAEKINGENQELLRIKAARKLLRLELQDGVARVAGSGLQGRTGHSAMP